MTNKDIEAMVAQMQQLLERDYARLEWRVRVGPVPRPAESHDPWVFVHARTRDFQYRCRVGRPWTAIAASPTLGELATELAAEAERLLAQQAAP